MRGTGPKSSCGTLGTLTRYSLGYSNLRFESNSYGIIGIYDSIMRGTGTRETCGFPVTSARRLTEVFEPTVRI
jgi:hypothetical protein